MTKPKRYLFLPARAYAVFINGRLDVKTIRRTAQDALTIARLWYPWKKLTLSSVRKIKVT